MLPIGTRIWPGRPDYCRRCETITRHSFYVAGYGWSTHPDYDSRLLTEACGWSCTVCGEEGNARVQAFSMLAAAGLEPEAGEGTG